jgi:hypothetical protein
VYKAAVKLEGETITAQIFEETQSRPAGDVPGDNPSLQLKSTLTATDSSFTSGAWGPITASQPDTYFWDLSMQQVQEVNHNDENILRKVIPVSKEMIFPQGSATTSTDIELTDQGIEQYFAAEIQTALANQGVPPERFIQAEYTISNSDLVDVEGNPIPHSSIIFRPAGAMEQQTTDPNAIIWAVGIIVKHP